MTARYEPIIVTTLRRYVRRGAPGSLIERLAGGARDWRTLNLTWDIDGTAELVPALIERPRLALDAEVLALGFHERRIALAQIVQECNRRDLQCPRPDQLARYFGCATREVLDDLRWIAISTGPAQMGRSTGAAAARRVEA